MRINNFSKRVKRQAYERSNGNCEVCGKELTYGNVEYHHIIEAYLDGAPEVDNCLVACRKCHGWLTKIRRPEIDKTRRIEEKRMNIRTKRQGFRGWRKMNGTIRWRTG